MEDKWIWVHLQINGKWYVDVFPETQCERFESMKTRGFIEDYCIEEYGKEDARRILTTLAEEGK